MATRIFRAVGLVILGLALAPSARASTLGSWGALPSMATARDGPVAAALGDGRVLVAGGLAGAGAPSASAEIYDPVANTWSPASPMGTARAFAAAAPMSGDRVLVAGGEVAGGGSTAGAEIYSGTTNTWSPAAPMASARDGATAVTLSDGRVWVAGGNSSGSSEIYDPVAGSWVAAAWMPATAGGVAVTLPDGQVFMGGGYEPAGSILYPWWGLQSPSSTSWSGVGSSAPPYRGAAALLSDGTVLLAGGSQSQAAPEATAAANIYDPSLSTSTAAWSAAASMATPRYGAAAAPLPDGRVLVTGGEGVSGPLASAEAFTAPQPVQPVNTTSPWIQDNASMADGKIRIGDVLSVGLGSWNDAYEPGVTESFQWQRCLSTCENVSSTLAFAPGWGPTYLVTAADQGATLRVLVTITDHGLAGTALSNSVGPVVAPGFHLFGGSFAAMLPELATGRMSYLEIPVIRDQTAGPGFVSYRVWDHTGAGYPGLAPMTGTLYFLPGQSIETIDVTLTSRGVPIIPGAIDVALFGGSPLGVTDPAFESVTVRDPSSPLYVRDPANPLGVTPAPPPGNPLGGARFFADYFQSLPVRQALAWSASDPWAAAKVAVIAREPNVQRFGAWNGAYPGWNVASYLNRAAAEEPGTVPMISTYRLVYGHCGQWADPLLEQAAYHDFISGLAQGIGTHPAVLFLEMDSLITVGCLSSQGVAVRMHELRDAINVLANDPHLVVYLDAGAADALPAAETASLLRRAGIAHIQGFFLNSTHFDWTSREIRYGERISRLVGGKHFVVNTAENGQGPLRPRNVAKQGNEVLCDPVGRGLGPLPTGSTGFPNVDAFAWIANPGVSGGHCRAGAPPSGVFWPGLALELVRHEDFRVR